MLAAVGYASVQARVRARRSRLLSPEDWSRLVAAPGPDRALDELALGPYGPASLSASDIGAFERDLRRRVDRETRSLASRLPARAADLVAWTASRVEVQDLKLLIRALHHGRSLAEAHAGLIRQPSDDPLVVDLRGARTLAGLLAAAERTAYGRALANAWERYRSEHRPFYLEVALDLAHQRGLVDRIDALGGADRTDAVELLGRWLARQNLLAAVRYRALAGVSPEQVVNFCLHRDFGGGLAMVQRIAAGAPMRSEAAALGVALSREGDERSAVLELERRSDALRREAARLRFAGMPFGLGLVLAYLILLEAEADDLVRVLEAKTQGLEDADVRLRLLREVA